jgi:hypothetical protein
MVAIIADSSLPFNLEPGRDVAPSVDKWVRAEIRMPVASHYSMGTPSFGVGLPGYWDEWKMG